MAFVKGCSFKDLFFGIKKRIRFKLINNCCGLIRLYFIILIVISGTCNAQTFNGQEIIEKSIHFHDPENIWMKSHIILDLKETRHGGTDRNTLVEINNTSGYFNLTRQLGDVSLRYEIKDGNCNLYLNGESNFSEIDREKYSLNEEGGRFLRDYYLYLWGMPMKLLDWGTVIENEVVEIDFNSVESYQVRVTYNKEVGSDTWYFYFNRTDFQLHAYQFYHDEDINDGEYILLKNLMKVGSMNIPKERSWFVNKDHKYLGNDILENNILK